MESWRRVVVLVLLPLMFCGCKGLGRRVNQALPEFLRSDPGKEEMRIFADVRRAREWTPEELEAQERTFNSALEAHSEERWDDAASILEDYLESYPTSRFDERARFLLAESKYFDEEWSEAFKAFSDFNDLYLVSDYGPQVMEYQYQIGKSYIEGERSVFFGIFSNRSIGQKYLNQVVERFPTGKRAPDAQWLLSQFYMRDGDWVQAAPAFAFLADNYPDSEWFPAARYYGAYCLYRQVKGAIYDPGVQKQAREAFEKYLRDVPEGEWIEDATRFRDEVAELEAQHLLEVGRWYIKMGKPWSARYYLESVRVRHPGSKAAEAASEVLAGLPGGPPGVLEAPAPGAAPTRPAAPTSAPASRGTGGR